MRDGVPFGFLQGFGPWGLQSSKDPVDVLTHPLMCHLSSLVLFHRFCRSCWGGRELGSPGVAAGLLSPGSRLVLFRGTVGSSEEGRAHSHLYECFVGGVLLLCKRRRGRTTQKRNAEVNPPGTSQELLACPACQPAAADGFKSSCAAPHRRP